MDAKQVSQLSPFSRLKVLLSTGIIILGVILAFASFVGTSFLVNVTKSNVNDTNAVQVAVQSLERANSAVLNLQQSTSNLISFTDTLSDEKAKLYLKEELSNLTSLLLDTDRETKKALSALLTAFPKEKDALRGLMITSAYAQDGRATGSGTSIDLMRPYIMVGVILSITAFFFICIFLFCTTSDTEKIKFADNMMRTIVGFYIGIVTGLLGLPS